MEKERMKIKGVGGFNKGNSCGSPERISLING